MKLIISHQTALEYWRKANTKESPAGKKLRTMNPAIKPFKTKELEHESLSNLTKPLHVLVGSVNARRVRRGLHCHVSPGEFPSGSFIQMPSGLIVSSPELCFVQMAGELPFAELVALGYELCGSYRIDKDNTDGKGFREELPLTNAAGLRSYAAKAAGLKGLNNSKQALNFIIDRSASPMETILAMMLTLPYRYGGYGFSKPQLNYRIEVPTNFGKAAGKNGLTVYYCDLYWNDKQVDVEYDSDAFHASSEQIFKDAVRRNALTKTGVTVITVSRKQIFEKESFRELAETLAKLLGKRLKCAGKDFRICQNKLRLQLLPRVGNG